MNVPLNKLVGRTVRDPDGRDVGEIEELRAEIEQRPHGNDYVVTAVEVGRYRMLDMVVSGWFVPAIVKRWRERVNYRRYVIPWEWLDLRDLEHPRVLRPMSELPTD